MATTERTVYGSWMIYERGTDTFVDAVECHYPPGSSQFERAERGLYRRVDFERFYVEWRPEGRQ